MCLPPVQGQATGFTRPSSGSTRTGPPADSRGESQAKLTLTNLDTGETITVSAAGPLHVTQNADGGFTVVETGLWGFRLENPKTASGACSRARVAASSVDAEGNETDRFVGRVTDLCAELAAWMRTAPCYR